MPPVRLPSLLFVALVFGCGGSTDADGPAGGGTGGGGTGGGGTGGVVGGGGTGGSSGGSGGGAGAGACAGFVAKASPAEIAKTPRANESAEVLAIETSGAFVAPDALYERIVSELPAIESAEPLVAGMTPFSFAKSNSLILGFDSAGYAAYKAGTYADWKCPNEAYGMTQVSDVGSLAYVTLEFGDKRYNTLLLAKEYVGLPHVTSADPNSMLGDGPDVCLEIQGDTHFYIYDKAGGDCPAGCTEHMYYGFEVAAGAAVKKLGSFDPALPTPAPAWFEKLKECQKRL